LTVQGAVESLFDRRVAPVAVPITAALPFLLRPEECAAVSGAVPRRQREFAAGRFCAHQAMSRLGCPDASIVMGADRAPVWPDGLVGSISHCDAWAAAVVARKIDGILSLGLDLEPPLPLPQDLVATILLPQERDVLETVPPARQLHYARLIFCAKEAFFKCQYALTGALVGFEIAEIKLDLAQGTFRAVLTDAIGAFPVGHGFQGRFHLDASIMAAGALVDA
jgi:4'-phosphopantetheinyl transferase EntD